jgi:hypothetical protein
MQKTPLSNWLVSNQVPHRNLMDNKHVKISFFTMWVGKDSNMSKSMRNKLSYSPVSLPVAFRGAPQFNNCPPPPIT